MKIYLLNIKTTELTAVFLNRKFSDVYDAARYLERYIEKFGVYTNILVVVQDYQTIVVTYDYGEIESSKTYKVL